MANLNKKISDTAIRIGEVRFGYVNVFQPRKNDNGGADKYSVQLLIPKSDTVAKKYIDEAVEAAKQAGVSSKWNGKLPPAVKLHLPLRDGDEEFPDDETYAGHWFMNASSVNKPGVRVLENGTLIEALVMDDFYSGCYGCATLGFFAYNNSGNMGIAAGLNNVLKTRDGDKLAGGHSAEDDFGDLIAGAGSCLD